MMLIILWVTIVTGILGQTTREIFETPPDDNRLVRPEIGMIISKLAPQSLPGNEMYLVFEIADVVDVTFPVYNDTACTLHVTYDEIQSIHSEDRLANHSNWTRNFMNRLTTMCSQYTVLQRTFEQAHSLIISHNDKLRTLARSLVDESVSRKKRSFWGGVRQIFNLGSHSRQRALAIRIAYLRSASKLQYGRMQDMEMVLKATTNATEMLIAAANVQHTVITNMRNRITLLSDLVLQSRRADWVAREVAQRATRLTTSILVQGSMGGQLLQLQGQLLRDRYMGLTDASHGVLSSLLVSPEMLSFGLEQFNSGLSENYRDGNEFRIKTQDPTYYYRYSKVALARADGRWYLQIPINVFKLNGQFSMFQLTNYHLPLHGNKSPKKYTRCTGFSEYVAVSEDHQTYIELDDNEFLTHCKQPEDTKCLAHKTVFNISHMTCSMAIIMNNKTAVKRHCVLEYVILTELPPTFIVYLGTGEYFVMNYKQDPWRSVCSASADPVSFRHVQLQFQLSCNCYLSTSGAQTPSYLDASCNTAGASHVKYNQYPNLIYLSYLMRKDVAGLETNMTDDRLTVPAQIELDVPKFSEHEAIDSDVVFNLEKLCNKLDRNMTPGISHLDVDMNDLFDDNNNSQIGRIVTLLSIATSAIASVGLAILCIRNAQLAKTVAMISILQPVKAENELADTQVELIMILQFILCAIAALFLTNRLYKWAFGTKLSTVICTQLSRVHQEAESEIRMEVNSMVQSVDFHVTKIHAPADSITVTGEVNTMGIQVEDRCLGTGIVLDWHTVKVNQEITKTENSKHKSLVVKMPQHITVHDVNSGKLRHMLNDNCRVYLLVGNGRYFTRFSIGHTGYTRSTGRDNAECLKEQPYDFGNFSHLRRPTFQNQHDNLLYGIPNNDVIAFPTPAVKRYRSADNGGFEEVSATEKFGMNEIYATVAETQAKAESAPELPPKQSFRHQLAAIKLACEEHDQRLGPLPHVPRVQAARRKSRGSLGDLPTHNEEV